jgi:hypothetical protein
MKVKKTKKLVLNKAMIANLNSRMMNNIVGKGETETACGTCYWTQTDCCGTLPNTLCDCPDTDLSFYTCETFDTCGVTCANTCDYTCNNTCNC